MFVELVALACLIFFTKWYFNRRIFLSHLKRYPVPPGLPLFGNILEFANPYWSLPVLLKYMNNIGKNTVFYLGTAPYLLIGETNLNELVLASNKLLDKSEEYKYFQNWFGEGLLTSAGYKWRSHRKILTPSFHYKILEDFVEVFDSANCIFVKKLNKEVGKDSFDCYQYISLCTLDIICETAMGTSVNAQQSSNSEYVRSIKSMCDILYKRVFSILLRHEFIYRLSPTYQKEKKALKVLHNYTENVILKRREAMMKETTTDDIDDFGIKNRKTFLDVLLQSTIDGEFLTNMEIREEVDTFMFEGHDTTGVAIAFAVFTLSKHLDIQQKVVDEFETIFGKDKERPCTFEDLQNMKYLELVIKECLRLYPSVPVFTRIIKEDIEYEGDILPEGLTVIICPYIIHRNPDYFPDPEKFDPERFTPENCLNRHPFAYVPFSAGPRNCIGQKFAMLELKSTISKMLRYYEILPAIPEHNVHPIPKVTIQSSTGIKIRLKERL